MLVGVIWSVLDVIRRIFMLLLQDPVNVFCLFLLFLGTLGYILILTLIRTASHRNISRKTRANSRESTEAKLKHQKLPIISFIIPAHNEENTIEKKLKNTLELNYPQNLLEVIVVDDGSTDKTPAILEAIQRAWFPKLKVIRQNRRGKSSAENTGLQNSSGEIIVISDADVALNRDSLRFMMENFKDPKVGGVTCTVVATEQNIEALNFKLGLCVRWSESEIDSSFGMAGSFVSFRKSILPKIDEGIFSSDADTGIMIRKMGYKVVYDPRIIAYVDIWIEGKPRSVVQAMKKLKHMSFGAVSVLRRHKDVPLRSNYGLFGWVIAPKRILFDAFAPVIFMILTVNSIVKLVVSNLMVPFTFLTLLFLVATFVSRKLGPYTTISRVLYFVFLHVIGYYATFFYYLVFILREKERRGVWEKFRV